MGIYIKIIDDGYVVLGGTVATDQMIKNGYQYYDGLIPTGVEFKLVDGVLVPISQDKQE